jgi:DNA modification methylase
VEHTVRIFTEVWRVLRDHGTLWLNLGDSYAGGGQGGQSEEKRSENWQPTYGRASTGVRLSGTGLKPKDLVGIPWRVAFALQAAGWYLRSDIIWAKPNPMPESVTDRPTKAHEYVFLFSKSRHYYYDADAVREDFASSVSDLRKMAEEKDRMGDGKRAGITDPKYAANMQSRVGQKRGVGDAAAARALLGIVDAPNAELPWNAPGKNSREHVDRDPAHLADGGKQARARVPSGWNTGDGNHRALEGRYESQKDDEYAGRADPVLGRNMRSVWEIATQPYPEAHFATFPEELPRRCIKAGCPTEVCTVCGKPRERITGEDLPIGGRDSGNLERKLADGTEGRLNTHQGRAFPWEPTAAATEGFSDCGHASYEKGTVLDPFAGSGTTLAIARDAGRAAIGIELQPEYPGPDPRALRAGGFRLVKVRASGTYPQSAGVCGQPTYAPAGVSLCELIPDYSVDKSLDARAYARRHPLAARLATLAGIPLHSGVTAFDPLAASGRSTSMRDGEDHVLRLLLAWASRLGIGSQSRDPECACCSRGLFVGSHMCPDSVVLARQARAALAELEAGRRGVIA